MTPKELTEMVETMRALGVTELSYDSTTIVLGQPPAATPPDDPHAKGGLTPHQIMNRRKFAHVGG